MRKYFDDQLKELNRQLKTMGELCEDCITCSTQALLTGAEDLAEKAIEIEKEIDISEREIQNLCLKLLLQQQPVAHDLKTISAALKMITDMERIGDQGSDIAELLKHMNKKNLQTENSITTKLANSQYIKNAHIASMADSVIRMVTGSIHSFITQDEQLAYQIIDLDNEVDTLFAKVKNDILNLVTDGIRHNRDIGEQAIDSLLIAKYLERIGDHAVNIAEWVLFSMGIDIKKLYKENQKDNTL